MMNLSCSISDKELIPEIELFLTEKRLNKNAFLNACVAYYIEQHKKAAAPQPEAFSDNEPPDVVLAANTSLVVETINRFLREALEIAGISDADYANLAKSRLPVNVFADLIKQGIDGGNLGKTDNTNSDGAKNLPDRDASKKILSDYISKILNKTGFRSEVLEMAVKEGSISAVLVQSVLMWHQAKAAAKLKPAANKNNAHGSAETPDYSDNVFSLLTPRELHAIQKYRDYIETELLVRVCVKAAADYMANWPLANSVTGYLDKIIVNKNK